MIGPGPPGRAVCGWIRTLGQGIKVFNFWGSHNRTKHSRTPSLADPVRDRGKQLAWQSLTVSCLINDTVTIAGMRHSHGHNAEETYTDCEWYPKTHNSRKFQTKYKKITKKNKNNSKRCDPILNAIGGSNLRETTRDQMTTHMFIIVISHRKKYGG
jgi:hypothetical protein